MNYGPFYNLPPPLELAMVEKSACFLMISFIVLPVIFFSMLEGCVGSVKVRGSSAFIPSSIPKTLPVIRWESWWKTPLGGPYLPDSRTGAQRYPGVCMSHDMSVIVAVILEKGRESRKKINRKREG